jgi:hypothetical protein
MRLVAIAVILTLALCPLANAQGLDESNLRDHEATPLPTDARYAFVQSHIAVSGTYRLDRYTGDVYQMIQKADGDLTWDKLLRLPHSDDKGQKDGAANYQLFLSGFQMRHTFLMNVRSGATWEILEDPKTKQIYWGPIK